MSASCPTPGTLKPSDRVLSEFMGKSPVAHVLESPKRPVYFIEEFGDRLKPTMRRHFETYSGISGVELERYLYAARESAWQAHPYPCIGMWTFLNPILQHLHCYPSLLTRARQPGTRVLDIGCGMGQDLRQLLFDGVPLENLHASDITDGLWRAGLELWKDADSWKDGRFRLGNLLDLDEKPPLPAAAVARANEVDDMEQNLAEEPCLADWKSTFDIVHAGNTLHLFKGASVLLAATNLVRLTRPGGWVVLHQIGGPGRNADSPPDHDFPGWRHNGESWRGLWEQVQGVTGVAFEEVETAEGGFEEWGAPGEDVRWFPPGSRAFQVLARRGD